jgi:hypothetical protein
MQPWKELVVNTHKRSGTVHICTLLGKTLNVKVIQEHDVYITQDPVISIVREPVGCIASAAVFDISLYNLLSNIALNRVIDSRIKTYKEFLEHVIKNVNVIFDFDDINKTEEIVKYVSDLFEIEYRPVTLNPDNVFPDTFLLSSKVHSQYDQILQIVKSKNLRQCHELFNKALERKVIL